MLWIKRFLSFLLICAYLMYLIYLRIIALFVHKEIDITFLWITIRIGIILIFIFLLYLQVLKLKKPISTETSKYLLSIGIALNKLYLEANNFLNTSKDLYNYLNKVCSNFVYFCQRYNKFQIYLLFMIVPYLIVAFIFITEIINKHLLHLFYYALPITFITLFIKYLLYRAEQLYLIRLFELEKKSLVNVAFPQDEFYKVITVIDLVDFLTSTPHATREHIKIIVTPSIEYLRVLLKQKKDTYVIAKSLNEQIKALIVFRRTLLELTDVKTRIQPYFNIILYLIYIIGWSYYLYLLII